MADPSPSVAFNQESDGLHACSFVEFLIGNVIVPVDSQKVSKEGCGFRKGSKKRL